MPHIDPSQLHRIDAAHHELVRRNGELRTMLQDLANNPSPTNQERATDLLNEDQRTYGVSRAAITSQLITAAETYRNDRTDEALADLIAATEAYRVL